MKIEARVRGTILVRDKEGKPRVDDPKNLPPELLAQLTDAERQELGVN